MARRPRKGRRESEGGMVKVIGSGVGDTSYGDGKRLKMESVIN